MCSAVNIESGTESKSTPLISVVSPLYCEEGNVSVLVERLDSILSDLDESFEIILVDDGSQDGTWKSIAEEAKKYSHVKGVKLSRNFGHQHALLAGLAHTKGQAVISLDGDLQHPPELIPELISKWKEGYSIVNTCRNDVLVASTFKRTSSRYFYKFFSAMTNIEMSEGSSDFRLLDRVVLDNMLEFNDVDLFLRGAVQWLGFKSTTVPYEAAERYSGESKYNLTKMLIFSRSAILSFSTKPLMIGVWIGFITSFLSFLEIGYIVIQYFLGNTVPGWASTLSVLAFLFGVLFIILGVIGMYLARIHISLQNRPRFVAESRINFDDD